MGIDGDMLRLARLDAGFSLAEMARKTSFAKCYLGFVETGRRRVTPAIVTAYARVLGPERLGDVDRRNFIKTVAGVVAPITASELLQRGFTAALGDRPSAEHWFGALDLYGRDYMTSGADEIRARLANDLVVLQQQTETPHLWEVAAKLATLYGKTFPGSDGAKAANWYHIAARAADRSGDATARVWVRGRAAIAFGYEGASLNVADTMADQALAISDKPSLGRLNAIMGKAHIAALQNDKATARRLLDEGRRVFDAVGSDDQASDYAVPEWRMNVFISLLAARLGDEHTAVDAQDRAARLLPASLPRFATHLEMHRGLMLVQAGDHIGGVAHARAALQRLPPEKHSLTLRMLMAEVEQTA